MRNFRGVSQILNGLLSDAGRAEAIRAMVGKVKLAKKHVLWAVAYYKEKNASCGIDIALKAGMNEEAEKCGRELVKHHVRKRRFADARRILKTLGLHGLVAEVAHKEVTHLERRTSYWSASVVAERAGQEERAQALRVKAVEKYEKNGTTYWLRRAANICENHGMPERAYTNNMRMGRFWAAAHIAEDNGWSDKAIDAWKMTGGYEEAAEVAKRAGKEEEARALYRRAIDDVADDPAEALMLARDAGLEEEVHLSFLVRIKNLEEEKKFSEAGSIAFNIDEYGRAVDNFERAGEYANAAQAAEKNGEYERAVENYVLDGNAQAGLYLAKKRELHGLVERFERDMIGHLENEKEFVRAAKVAETLGLADKAQTLYGFHVTQLEEKGHYASAASFAERAGQPEREEQLWLKALEKEEADGKFGKALGVSRQAGMEERVTLYSALCKAMR